MSNTQKVLSYKDDMKFDVSKVDKKKIEELKEESKELRKKDLLYGDTFI